MIVRLLFYRGEDLAAWLVRKWTKSRFAHVAIRIADNAGDDVYEAVWSGVRKRPWSITDGTSAVNVMPEMTEAQAQAARAFLEAQVGCRYDKAALVLDVLTRHAPHYLRVSDMQAGEWDCSRLASAACDIDDTHSRGPLTPGDVYDLVTAK